MSELEEELKQCFFMEEELVMMEIIEYYSTESSPIEGPNTTLPNSTQSPEKSFRRAVTLKLSSIKRIPLFRSKTSPTACNDHDVTCIK
jgi:hypothetical protein